MGSRREQWLIVLLVLLVLVLAIVTTPGDDAGSFDPRPSTFRSAPPGTLALYLTLEALDVPVARRLAPWVDGVPLDGTLVMLAPSTSLTPLEVATLLDWVDEGGTLVVAGGRFEGPAFLFLEPLGLGRAAIPGGAQPALGAAGHPWSRDTRVVEGFRWHFDRLVLLEEHPDAEIVLRTASGGHPVVVSVRLGAGRLVAWSDAGPLTNVMLRESGAAVVFARAAADLSVRGGPMVFDEYHHGYRDRVGPGRVALDALLSTPPGWMTLQLMVAALGLLWLHGRRFGSPYAAAPARRRSPLEHVDALASAYQQGAARATARRLVVAGLARRLGQSVPVPGQEEAWLRQLARRAAGDRRHAEALYEAWQRGAAEPLAALARQADLVAQEAGAPATHAEGGRR